MSYLRSGYRHFLNIDSMSLDDLQIILDGAVRLKGFPYHDILRHRQLAAIFEKPSTRTRASFASAMNQLGGGILTMTSDEMQLGRGETIADTARVLSRYVDLIMLRTDDEAKLLELAEYSSVPVINGLTDRTHPCQIMADIMCMSEHLGGVEGKVVAWSGDGNNMAVSWVQAAVKFGFVLHLACPDGLGVDVSVLDWARDSGGAIIEFDSAGGAVDGVDCVVTDCWVSMGDDAGGRDNLLRPYAVDEALMGRAKSGAIFMHCLPAHRGEEVTDGVMDGKGSVVWDEAENRLHVQKAIILWCLGLLGEV